VNEHVQILDRSSAEPDVHHMAEPISNQPPRGWIIETSQRQARLVSLESESLVKSALNDSRFDPEPFEKRRHQPGLWSADVAASSQETSR